jgi:hypothetical protein
MKFNSLKISLFKKYTYFLEVKYSYNYHYYLVMSSYLQEVFDELNFECIKKTYLHSYINRICKCTDIKLL